MFKGDSDMSTEFNVVKEQYEKAREAERRELAGYLSKDKELASRGITVRRRGNTGKGKSEYTSGKRIYKVDLRNWKWVQLDDAAHGFLCIISLNMPDIDPNSGNIHSLLDRVGVIITYKREKLYYKTEIITDIDLPLNAGDMEKIAELILEQYDFLVK